MADKPTHIFVRFEGRYIKIIFAEILYLESLQNFVKVHCQHKEILLLISLRQMERELPDTFCRVHRSFIVNTNNIQSFDKDSVSFTKKSVPVSRHFKDVLPQILKVVVSDTRSVSKMDLRKLLN